MSAWGFLNINDVILDDKSSVGIIVPIKGENLKYLVCADRSIIELTWNPLFDDRGKEKELAFIEPWKRYNQFNDGKCDSAGRLWIGIIWQISF